MLSLCAHALFNCNALILLKGTAAERRGIPPDILPSAHAVLFPCFSVTHSMLALVTAHLQPPAYTQSPKPPAELKRENLKIVNAVGSLKRKRGRENEWGKAPAVKNSRSCPFDSAIYRTQLEQNLPQCHENFIRGALRWECFYL